VVDDIFKECQLNLLGFWISISIIWSSDFGR